MQFRVVDGELVEIEAMFSPSEQLLELTHTVLNIDTLTEQPTGSRREPLTS